MLLLFAAQKPRVSPQALGKQWAETSERRLRLDPRANEMKKRCTQFIEVLKVFLVSSISKYLVKCSMRKSKPRLKL